ncbi:SRPBCC family protein [Cellulomonas sp. URHD0024]|uniref:SRPBCC family protein n=1 Tax=Cellulomonas sp. URHD0024 TaxID=1302620 RepID=UPI00040CA55A|nr:SRPBCC family protein [Cellulomonas sp. URHD0024]
MIVESSVDVPLAPGIAFAVSQTTGAARLRWDPFIRRQAFLDGATAPARGVRTLTRHRSGMRMVSEYVSYTPPTNVGMKMVDGPWFFAVMAGAWRFTPLLDDAGTRAVWRYSFTCRPGWLAPLAERVGRAGGTLRPGRRSRAHHVVGQRCWCHE